MADTYGLFAPETRADPYPLYHRLRAEDPVHWVEPWGPWVVTRYADVVAALRDPRLSVTGPTAAIERLPAVVQEDLRPYFNIMSMALIYSDPPAHTRLRAPLNRAFTPRAVESLRPQIQAIADDLLDAVCAAARLDVLHDFAHPLAALSGAAMLGVPRDDMATIKRWFDQIFAIFAGDLTDAAVRQAARSATFAVLDYFRAVLADRRACPRDDLLSWLVAPVAPNPSGADSNGAVAYEQAPRSLEEGHDEPLSEEELLGLCVQMMFSGRESTPQSIAKGVLALLQHPDQLSLLRDDPSLLPMAVEELLRFDGGPQAIVRVAADDLEIGGRRIGRGQRVFLMTGAANRDPAEFPDPDRLDLARQRNRHVAFGYGIHFCIGGPLARIEREVAFGTLLRRLPGLRLASEAVEWRGDMQERVLRDLPVAFDAEGAMAPVTPGPPREATRREGQTPQGRMA
jgi:cytochrome P450